MAQNEIGLEGTAPRATLRHAEFKYLGMRGMTKEKRLPEVSPEVP